MKTPQNPQQKAKSALPIPVRPRANILGGSQNVPRAPKPRPTVYGAGGRRNPGGRPKGLAPYVRQLTEQGEEPVALMLDVMRGLLVVKHTEVSKEGDVITYDEEPTHRDRMDAAKWLIDRGFGKAPEKVELRGPDGGPIQIDDIREKLAEKVIAMISATNHQK